MVWNACNASWLPSDPLHCPCSTERLDRRARLREAVDEPMLPIGAFPGQNSKKSNRPTSLLAKGP